MLFNTVEYGVFLVTVLVVFWLLRRCRTVRHLFLLLASYAFYASWNPRYLVLVLFSTVLDYAIGLALHDETRQARRRWHISLSTWLRDYLYIPLGGSRRGLVRTTMALAVTMLLGGLWHGAAWTFVAWGALHGVGLAVTRAVQRAWPDAGRSPVVRLAGALVTFHLVCLGWVVFRAPSFDVAVEVLAALSRWQTAPTLWLGPALTVVCVGYLSHLLPAAAKEASELWFGRIPAALQAAMLVVALAFFQTMSLTTQPFIYFQF
jgi:D-alanyl-lipoteichoic acid acyltransferase DltB (MBOAT superfamily)